MARVQPVLSPTELALVDQMAELTQSKRTDVIKSALAVYHWFVGQALIGSKVVARKSTTMADASLATPLQPLLKGKTPRGGAATVYICEHGACGLPVTGVAGLEQTLA